MTIKSNPNSMVACAVIAVVVLLAMGVVGKDQDATKNIDAAESLKEKVSSIEQRLFQKLTAPQNGRFQLRVSGDYVVILDTATGQARRHSLSISLEQEVCSAKLQPIAD